MDTTSSTLLARLRQADDQEAWSRFVDLYTPLIFHWARRAGLQPSDAADLVQEVFALLVRKLPEFGYDRHKSFRGWLRTVSLNKWRERHRRIDLPRAAIGESGLANLPGPDPAEEFWETEYHRQLVRRAAELAQSQFPPKVWQACWRFVVEGRPARDVAAELGISVWTVYAAKSRLLRYLRQELEGMLD